MTIESILDRTVGQAVPAQLERCLARAARSPGAVIGADRLCLSRLASGVQHAVQLELPFQETMRSIKDGLLSGLGMAECVWGTARQEKSLLAQARALLLRATLASQTTASNLCEITTAEIDRVISSLARRAISQTRSSARPPLVVAALGAYGRKEIGPFSSIDFAVLVGSDTPAAQRYARKVADRLGRLIKALGETKVLAAGFRAGPFSSPAGLFGSVLVSTPKQLAQAALDPSLPAEIRWGLHDLRPVFEQGAQLSEGFQAHLNRLRESALCASSAITLGSLEAHQMAASARQAQAPRKLGKLTPFDPNQDILGRLALTIRAISLRLGISGSTTLERIDKLMDQGVLDQATGTGLKDAATWAGNLTVQTQLNRSCDSHLLTAVTEREAQEAIVHLAAVDRLIGR